MYLSAFSRDSYLRKIHFAIVKKIEGTRHNSLQKIRQDIRQNICQNIRQKIRQNICNSS